jgi:hypothetical protein
MAQTTPRLSPSTTLTLTPRAWRLQALLDFLQAVFQVSPDNSLLFLARRHSSPKYRSSPCLIPPINHSTPIPSTPSSTCSNRVLLPRSRRIHGYQSMVQWLALYKWTRSSCTTRAWPRHILHTLLPLPPQRTRASCSRPIATTLSYGLTRPLLGEPSLASAAPVLLAACSCSSPLPRLLR